MVERLDGLVPEMMLLALAVVVEVLGLSKASSIRRAVPLLTAGAVAAWLAWGEESSGKCRFLAFVGRFTPKHDCGRWWCVGLGGFGNGGSSSRTRC